MIDPDIKYGGGPEPVQKSLAAISTTIAQFESIEYNLQQLEVKDINQQDIQKMRKEILELKENIVGRCNILSSSLE